MPLRSKNQMLNFGRSQTILERSAETMSEGRFQSTEAKKTFQLPLVSVNLFSWSVFSLVLEKTARTSIAICFWACALKSN